MEKWKNMRDAWTTARDQAKIKKGAVSGVSMGDAIDKVKLAGAKGYNPLLKATAALRKDVAKYISKVDKTAPAAVTWLKGTLLKQLDDLETRANADIATLAKVGPVLTPFHQRYVPGIPSTDDVKRTFEYMQKTPGMTWPTAANDMKLYAKIPLVVPKWEEIAKFMAGLKFQVALPGKPAAYAYFGERAKIYLAGSKVIAKYLTCKSYAEHLELLKSGLDAMTAAENQGTQAEEDAVMKTLLG